VIAGAEDAARPRGRHRNCGGAHRPAEWRLRAGQRQTDYIQHAQTCCIDNILRQVREFEPRSPFG
jgi:hypothetical protein